MPGHMASIAHFGSRSVAGIEEARLTIMAAHALDFTVGVNSAVCSIIGGLLPKAQSITTRVSTTGAAGSQLLATVGFMWIWDAASGALQHMYDHIGN